MRNLRKPLLLAAVLFLALISAGAAEAAGWSGNVRIATIEVSNVNAEGVWLSFTTPPFATSCPSKVQYWLQGGPSNVDKMTAIATSALVNSRLVAVYWDGTCASGYSVLKGITLK